MSKGFIYRLGTSIKDFGERLGHIRIFRIRIFDWLSGLVKGIGLKIRDLDRSSFIKRI
jgi:hypothetical protein